MLNSIDYTLMIGLADEIKLAGVNSLIPNERAEEISEFVRKGRATLTIPRKVSLNPKTKLVDLSYSYCTRCNRVEGGYVIPDAKCRADNETLTPVPIWYATPNNPSNNVIDTVVNRKMNLTIQDYPVKAMMGIKDFKSRVDSISISDRSRPLASMKAKAGAIEGSFPAAVQSGPFRYVLDVPSEAATKPITITSLGFDESKCTKLDATAYPGIASIKYCDELHILQATIGYKFGKPRGSNAEKFFVFDSDGERYKLPSRRIKTKGLLITIDDEYIDDFRVNKWSAYHTISHAFLQPASIISGLDPQEFAESIMQSRNLIGVFDNSEGGIGGMEGIVSDQKAFGNYQYNIRSIVKCPNDCFSGCKACLFTDSCYMLNFNLNRHALLRLGW